MAWTRLWKPLSGNVHLILNPSRNWILPLEKHFHLTSVFSFVSFGFLNNFRVLKELILSQGLALSLQSVSTLKIKPFL